MTKTLKSIDEIGVAFGPIGEFLLDAFAADRVD